MNTENHYQETDLGNISLNPRGEYNPEESYEYLDLVVLEGGSYVCLAENGATITGISPEPGKTTQYWQVITIPGSLTPEYIAMHDRVVNLSEQVGADAVEVRTAEQNVSGMELNVTQMQEQTRQSAEAAEQSKDSSAGYAASADASRQAAEESKQNIDAQVTGFDNHVAEKTGEAENDIEAARIAANKAIIAQQEQSVNEVARVGTEAVSTAQAAAQTAAEKAQAAATSEKNAAASETAAKLSEENATKMAEQVATDKEQVAYDRTAVENAKQEMTGSVAQIEQNTQGISELKGDLNDVESYLGYPRNYFDGRGLATTNPTNWTISTTKTSVTITHNNSYTTGTPTLALNIPVGEYVFHATHDGTIAFYLYIDGVYSSNIKDGSSLVIESGKTYMFEALDISSGVTQTITDISIIKKNALEDGVIKSIKSDVNAIESAVNEISKTVTITLSVEMESDTASTAATANGVESAGSGYHTVKFPVKGSDIAHVSVASTNWGNPYYIVCDSNGSVVAVSESSPSSSTVAEIHDFDVTIPTNGSYLIVNYLPTQSVTPTAYVTREVRVTKGVRYPLSEKKWVAIGDSLTEKNESASKNYVDWVCEKLGLTCVNMGVGGTGYMRGYDTNKAFYQRVTDIPNDADIITIFGSGNDLALYDQIGTPSDTDTSTICGCINTTLDYIANNFPTVPVVVIAPTIWKDQIPTENTSMTYYVQFLEEIAKKRSLHFLNLYSGGGLNPNNVAQLNTLFYHQTLDGNADGVHPNNAGHKIIAPKIKNAIECALIAD